MLAELAAMIIMAGEVKYEEGAFSIKFQTENAAIARKYFTIIKKAFNINTEIVLKTSKKFHKKQTYMLVTKDSKEAHAAALHYVDEQLDRLFGAFQKKGKTFVICCSDHGTCYGEDGVWFHGVNHPIVNTVPYKHFVLL